jgi:hypothetical protein
MSVRTSYYADYEKRILPTQQQLITYSFNEKELTINGVLLEEQDRIYLFEYRDRYIGNEFLISFSKNSIYYKLIKVEDTSPLQMA